MKTSIATLTLIVFSILGFATLSARAQTPKYSLAIKWTQPGADPVVTEAPNCALDIQDDIMIAIERSGEEPNFLIGDFEFGTEHRFVYVKIADPSIQVQGEKVTNPLEIFRAGIAFEFGEETTIFKTDRASLSFTLTPSPNNPPEKERFAAGEIEELPAEEAAKLEVSFQEASRGGSELIDVEIYNPSNFEIKELHVRVIADKKGDFAGIDRIYRMNTTCGPLSADDSSISPRLPSLPSGVEYQFKLEKAFGRMAR